MTIAQGSKTLGASKTITESTDTFALELAPGDYVFFCSVQGIASPAWRARSPSSSEERSYSRIASPSRARAITSFWISEVPS